MTLSATAIEISRYPLPRQREQARRSRRIALGITGLADALVMLGLRYDTEAAHAYAAQTMRLIRDVAYETSIDLAKEKGSFLRWIAIDTSIRHSSARCRKRSAPASHSTASATATCSPSRQRAPSVCWPTT